MNKKQSTKTIDTALLGIEVDFSEIDRLETHYREKYDIEYPYPYCDQEGTITSIEYILTGTSEHIAVRRVERDPIFICQKKDMVMQKRYQWQVDEMQELYVVLGMQEIIPQLDGLAGKMLKEMFHTIETGKLPPPIPDMYVPTKNGF